LQNLWALYSRVEFFFRDLFGLLFTDDLKNKTGLAVALQVDCCITGQERITIRYYPMYEIPRKRFFKIGEVLMNTMFISFASFLLHCLLQIFSVLWKLK